MYKEQSNKMSLPQEILNIIFYKYKGIQTPTAKIIAAYNKSKLNKAIKPYIQEQHNGIQSDFYDECPDCGYGADEFSNDYKNYNHCAECGLSFSDTYNKCVAHYLIAMVH